MECLFIGGPLHGQTRNLTDNALHFGIQAPQIQPPQIQQVKFEEELEPYGNISFTTIRYRKVYIQPPYAFIMASEDLSDHGANRKLGEYLTEQWAKAKQAEAIIKNDYMMPPMLTESDLAKVKKYLDNKLTNPTPILQDDLSRAFPDIDKPINRPCPRCNARFDRIRGMIIHLNDKEKMTFDEIADFIDSLPEPILLKEKK